MPTLAPFDDAFDDRFVADAAAALCAVRFGIVAQLAKRFKPNANQHRTWLPGDVALAVCSNSAALIAGASKHKCRLLTVVV